MSARVLIAGGGVAGLEAAFALRELAGDETEIRLCSPRQDFLYRPFSVGVPYGAARVQRYDLGEIASLRGFDFARTSVAGIDPVRGCATTTDGDRLYFDYAVLATGAKQLWSVPGATMFWGRADELDVERVVDRLGTSQLRRLAFAVPAGHSWSLPLYELALLAHARQSERGVPGARTELAIVTPEESPLLVFGRSASAGVAELLEESGIEVATGTHPIGFDSRRRSLAVVPEGAIDADAVIALPCLEGRRLAGVPHNEHGFVEVDPHCRVVGLDRVYAIGDVTAFPVKQGGIAAQQADAAAGAIAAELGCDVEAEPFEPVLRGVLWTGSGQRYLFGYLTGGHGEVSSFGDEPRWLEGSGKIVSRHLSSFLEEVDGGRAPAA